jgi:hypothetical protein
LRGERERIGGKEGAVEGEEVGDMLGVAGEWKA